MAEFNYSDFIGDDGAFDKILEDLDKIQDKLIETAKVAKQQFNVINPSDSSAVNKLTKEVKQLTVAQKNLDKARKTANKARKERKQLTDEELIQAQKVKLEQRERIKRAKQLAIIDKERGNTIKSLRAQLSLVSLDWAKLTAAETKNSARGKALTKQKRLLTEQLKKLEKQTGDNRRNVGNYTDSLSKLGKVAARVFIGRTIADGLRKIAGATAELIEQNKDADAGIGKLDTSIKRLTERGGGLGARLLSFVAPALTLVTNGLADLLDFITGVDTSVEKFTATSKELEGTIENLNKEFAKEVAAVDQVFTALENTNEGSKERKELVAQINEQYGKYLPNLLTEKSSLEEIAAAQDLVNEALSKNFLLQVQRETQTDIFINKSKNTISAFDKIRNAVEGSGRSFNFTLNDLQNFSRELTENANLANAFVGALEGDALTNYQAGVLGNVEGLENFATSLVLAKREGTNVQLLFKDLVRESNLFDKAIEDSQLQISALEKGLVTYDRTLGDNTNTTKGNTKALKDNTAARLKAIEELQNELLNTEAGNIEDRKERALRLEQLRFQEEQAQRERNFDQLIQLIEEQESELIRVYGEGSRQVLEFREQAQREILTIEGANQRLSEQQLIASENKKLEIVKQFAIKTNELKRITEEDRKRQRQSEIDAINDALGFDPNELARKQKEIAAEQERLLNEQQKKQEESSKQLLKRVSDTAKALSQEVSKFFQDQVDFSNKAVEEQEANLSAARDRASKGLENNLAFEEQQLAQRQSEQQKRQKEQEQAAKLLTLFNLVSAYAQNGDENALARGLVDFALLEALGASLGSFYDGTEDTGTVSNPLDNKGGRLAILHNNERVMTKAQNAVLGYMSNDDVVRNAVLGKQVSEGKNPFEMNSQPSYKQQAEDLGKAVNKTVVINDNQQVVAKLSAIERQLKKQPNIGVEIEKVYRNVYDIVKTEIRNAMRETGKSRL